ncbi:MAG: PAS domain-containing sensor histidine kinase [Bdellovibrionales bacterium]|nr:PAS domain-containing sensor histidine kinase [Bdellovibrionales bacterium]
MSTENEKKSIVNDTHHLHPSNLSGDFIKMLCMAVEQSGTILIITDSKGVIEYVNPKFAALTGYTCEEVLGKTPNLLSSGQTEQSTYVKMWESLSRGNEWHGDLLNKRKDGELFWGHLVVSPVKDECGNITHYVGIEEDVSDEKQAEAEYQRTLEDLKQTNAKLKELDNLKNEFLGMAAHDLRTPLGNVQLMSEMLQEDYLSEEQKAEFVRSIHRISTNMVVLLNELLDLTRIESGRIQLEREEVELQPFLNGIVNQYTLLGSKKEITISLKVEEGLGTVVFDPRRIEQVVNNLLSNALKFSALGTEVSVLASKDSDGLRIAVIDRGPGIDPSEQEKLFKPFERISTLPTGGEKSTGLGLAICKKLVELHGGSIQVKSQKGEGCTFEFCLPLGNSLPKTSVDVESSCTSRVDTRKSEEL